MIRRRGLSHWRRVLGAMLAVVAASLWTACDDHPRPDSTPSGFVTSVPNTPAKDSSESSTDSNDAFASRSNPRHPAFAERVSERRRMVAGQIQARGIQDPCVLEALRAVPRHAFVPKTHRDHAYGDSPLPISHGQTISQPYIVAFMTEALHLDRDARVLEVGTGSGYQAAVCAEIALEVYTIEIVPELAHSARQTLSELGYTNVHVRAGDGFFGWEEKAPFDAIIGTAAAGQIPKPLLEQLKPDGRMILPCEDADGGQYLVLITTNGRGELSQRQILPVRFVPMTGQVQRSQTR